MDMTGSAYFVHRPRRMADLRVPHLPDSEQTYIIKYRVQLCKTDYDNFISDFLADRRFLEIFSPHSAESPIPCILVRQAGQSDGVLVFPERESYVGLAAYYPGE